MIGKRLISQTMSRNEDEEYDEGDSNQDGEEQNHDCPLVQHLPHVGFPYSRPVHECILAKPSQSEDGIEGVLLRSERIYTYCEW